MKTYSLIGKLLIISFLIRKSINLKVQIKFGKQKFYIKQNDELEYFISCFLTRIEKDKDLHQHNINGTFWRH